MSAAEWPRSILPAGRDNRFNQLMDAICEDYRGLEDGDELVGVFVCVRDGHGQGWALVRIDGELCRIPVSEEWLDVRPEPDTGQVA